MKVTESARQAARYSDGRDEMNLADFPISALLRAQKIEDGRKVDRMELIASRYDPATRQRVQQRVILTSTASDGLPTPADEHVILALLYVGKHTTDYADATVHFAPSTLFDIMGWAPNGRSYTRLRDVLRRLQALTIRYENAWWDKTGRAYEEEVATSIISGYRLARQVSGPRTADTELASWVTWSPQFQESLQAGNLKRLNLDIFFGLSTPTAQRIYRFLDKRFYSTTTLSMDLNEFAYGHVGLTEVDNVAILKRRLAPAITELEEIGFIRPLSVAERYQKVKTGQWRIQFQAGEPREVERGEEPRQPTEVPEPRRVSPPVATPEEPASPAAELAREFYRLWGGSAVRQPGPRDLEQAEVLLADRTPAEARSLLECLVKVTRQEWPDCRSLSGAVQKYLPTALGIFEEQRRRAASQEEARRRTEQSRREQTDRQEAGARLQSVWDALPLEQRDAIEQAARARLGVNAPAVFVRRWCLEELGRRLASGQ